MLEDHGVLYFEPMEIGELSSAIHITDICKIVCTTQITCTTCMVQLYLLHMYTVTGTYTNW